ncbi:MAG TPA: protein kinase [Pyrinomonadaceae bacterium]|nr:protein kinase [Pyrinomonadaceae bacterium]
MNPHLQPGTKLGRYEIRSHIGAGGMGDVYQARDTELDRMVALKVLPSLVAADQQRMRRFIQEAKAASSLNHQNIITIYEIGDDDSTRFIATEFIDGITLRQHLKRGRLTVAQTIDIAIQVATGLAAAHDAGIVHRDVKPENIMLRNRDGFVKLLDFGLVKLTEASTNTADTEAPTRALVNTDAGTVMGTVVYMSPEQARGKPVDERTDIWSLGVILYEMLTGVTPFSGETSADVIAAIVKTDPAPVSRFSPNVPAKLEEIVSKILEKDRDERYQTIKDLLVDLRRLKKRLDFETETERSLTPESVEISARPSTITGTGSQTASLDSIRPTSSAEYLVSEIKRHKTGVLLAVIGIPAVLILLFLAWTMFAGREKAAPAPASMKITKLTSGGRVNNILIDGSTSISPDGRYVVYTLIDAGKVSIWVRQILTGSDVQIVPPSNLRNNGTTISNDGEFVYYIGINSENPGGSLFQVPILGGQSRKVLAGVRSPVGFSPDGSQFAFVRENQNQESILMIANSDGTNERSLAMRKGNDWFATEGPAWSPDGKTIACGTGTDTGGTSMTVSGYSVADGSQKVLTSRKWNGEVKRVLWLKDGSGLITPVQDSAQGSQLWFISQPEGDAKRITNDLNGYGSVSFGVSGDGKTIVTVQSKPSFQIWTVDLGARGGQPVQISHGENDGQRGIAWLPDGRIVFGTATGEFVQLTIANADGSGAQTLLKSKEPVQEPTVSPDGKTIYFTSLRSGTPQIWRVNVDGTELKQITFGDFANFSPKISPDGKWLLFVSYRSGFQALWKLAVDGGEPQQVTEVHSALGMFSPDGKLIGAAEVIAGGSPPWQLALITVDGSSPVKLITPPTHFILRDTLAWSSDGRAILVKSDQGGVGNLWSQPIDGSGPKQITNFTSDLISWFAVSHDGKRLAISRGNSALDVVLIKDFR